jgi:hypothetical protein
LSSLVASGGTLGLGPGAGGRRSSDLAFPPQAENRAPLTTTARDRFICAR